MTRWHVEQRLYFNLGKVVEQAEREEGMTYPEDQLSCKTFEYITVIAYFLEIVLYSPLREIFMSQFLLLT
jgi:hypothetical protein